MLTDAPKHVVHHGLIARPEGPSGEYDPVEVRMVRDGEGYTYHERRPHLVKAAAGATVTVSRNLALLWAASGICVLYPIEEPAAAADVEPSPAAAAALEGLGLEIFAEEEAATEEPEPDPAPELDEPAPEPEPAPKRARHRKRR